MRIALFATCSADTMFPQAAQATATILEHLSHQICFSEGQVCCGQMHANTGYFRQVIKVIRNHVGIFSLVLDGEWDAIVIPSDSCTGTARHEQGLVAGHMGDTAPTRRVEQIAAYTHDLTGPLIDVLGTEDVGAYFPHMVAYRPTCHSLRVAKVADRPYRLFKAAEALALIDLPDVEVCYGFGDIFPMKNSEISTAMLADKMSNMISTRAEVLCTGDYSCLIHIDGDPSHVNSGVHVMHLAEILASTKDMPFEGNISFTSKHVRCTGNS